MNARIIATMWRDMGNAVHDYHTAASTVQRAIAADAVEARWHTLCSAIHETIVEQKSMPRGPNIGRHDLG